jgi:hypothetical protein
VLPTPLNSHSRESLEALAHADTVTLDPHKTGLIPYPSGALAYRNGLMRDFVTLHTPVLYLTGDETSMGMCGLLGSKPGAPAVATLLSHRVIGLGPEGYGRIMAQCMTGAKLFYCLLTTLAGPGDPFLCAPLRPLPCHMGEEEARDFILTRIISQPSHQLVADAEAIRFLSDIGPDAMVNAFVVNIRGNRELGVAEELTELVFRRLSSLSVLQPDKCQVPLYLTRSSRAAIMGRAALDGYMARAGLPPGPGPLPFLISTSLNPWETRPEEVAGMRDTLRQAILCSLGQIQDPPADHSFVAVAGPGPEGDIFCHYVTGPEAGRAYQAVLRLAVAAGREALAVLPPPLTLTVPGLSLPGLAASTGRLPATAAGAGPGPPLPVTVQVAGVLLLRRLSAQRPGDRPPPRHWLDGRPGQAVLSRLAGAGGAGQGAGAVLEEGGGRVPGELLARGLELRLSDMCPDTVPGPLEAGRAYTAAYTGPGGALAETTLRLAAGAWGGTQ